MTGLLSRLLWVRARTFVAVLVLASVARGGNVPESSHAPVDVSADVERIIQRHKIPGMVVLALRGDRVIAQGAAGVRKRGTDVAVQLGDKFEIASCSKPMTAALIGLLVQEGVLRYDMTLGEIFGDSMPKMKPAWRGVTVRQVMNHRAGFAREPLGVAVRVSLFGGSNLTRQRHSVVRSLLSREPDVTPGGKFVYTSAAYVVLGAIAEKVTGRQWEELMQERLFGPLGMSTAGFGPPRGPGKLDQPWGHGPRFYVNPFGWFDNAVPRSPTSFLADAPSLARPAGLMHMTIQDWAKFAVVALRTHSANPGHVAALLKADAYDALMTPLPDTKLPGSWGGGTYAAGWVVSRTRWAKGPRPGDEGRILWQQGDNSRWNSAIALAPEIDLAVLVVCNRAFVWGASGEVARMVADRFADGRSSPGEDIAGRWHGALSRGSFVSDRRITLEVSRSEDGTLKALLATPDDKTAPPVVTAISQKERTLHLQTSSGWELEGTLTSDGSAMVCLYSGDRFKTTVVFKREPRGPSGDR